MYIQGQKEKISELICNPLRIRQNVQREGRRFLNSCYQRYPDIERLIVKRSFGLYGIPIEVYWDRCDDERSQSALWELRKEQFDITAHDRNCVFCTAGYAGNKIMDYIPNHLSWDKKTLLFPMCDLSIERMKVCVDDMAKFNPAWLCLAPSIAVMLAEIIVSSGILPPPGLRYIELSGEMLDDKTERMIQNVFHVRTSNVYATKEIGPIAIACENENLRIISENVEIQVIREGKPVVDEEGDIYVVSLQNNATPYAWVKTGDRGILQNVSCPCGQKNQVLFLTESRKCSFIVTVSGRKISSLMLRSVAEYVNEEMSRCLEHIRFRQTGYDSMEVILGVKPAFAGWEDEVARGLLSKIEDLELKQMRWNFKFVDSCSAKKNDMKKEHFFSLGEGVGL